MSEANRPGKSYSLRKELHKRLEDMGEEQNSSASRVLENILIEYFGEAIVEKEKMVKFEIQ